MGALPVSSKVKLQSLGGGRYELTIYGEDHTIGNLLAKTLLSMDEVEFAYYEKPHHLEDRIVVFINLKDPEADPVNVLAKALDKILRVNSKFRKLYVEALKAKGLTVES
ncbi:MAG: RpoL/Rpb11 RNA polymerase subunit family protein [Acidilobaceae archaeon]